MEVEHCIREDGQKNRKNIHRNERTVIIGWPDDENGIEVAQKGQPETLKHDKDGKDTSTIRWKDFNQDI